MSPRFALLAHAVPLRWPLFALGCMLGGAAAAQAPAALPSAGQGAGRPAADVGATGALLSTAKASTSFVYVFDQDLRSFLTDYCRRVGLRSEIDGAVRGRISQVRLPLDPDALMTDLAGRFDIEWYVEGGLLRVAPRSELTTRVISLRAVAYDDLVAALKASDLDVSRYPLRPLKDSDAVILRAPASYVGRVVALVETLSRSNGDGVVRVIRFGAEREPPKP